MTAPPSWRRCSIDDWTTGQVLFRSVILLFGLIPVDVHALRLDRILPDRGFQEDSTSWMNKRWQHERTTARTAAGCVVTDVVTVQGRVAPLTVLLMPVYRLVFAHRHRRLRRLYPVSARAV